jgi:tRNA pseudouridine55 synthase
MSDRASGILLVDKPAGVTSHDVVERVRREGLAPGAKVGHAGTLDPFATGLLLVLLARATRFQRFFMDLPKTYRARARLGAISDTGDPTGSIEPTGKRVDGAATLEASLPALTGQIEQRVPLTSAVKVGGERLYRKARRGESFETPVRTVHVMRLELLGFDAGAQEAELEVECSSGTYVRRLVSDLGELCGVGAYCAALQRTAIGPFELLAATDQHLVPLGEALGFMPERALAAEEEVLVRSGRAIPDDLPTADSHVRLTIEGALVAVAERREGLLKPVVVIPGEDR